MLRTLPAILAATCTAVSLGDLALQGLSTSAPPTSIGGYNLITASPDMTPIGTVLTNLTLGPGQSVAFTGAMQHLQVTPSGGWSTWSHGYQGDVYFSMGANSVRLDFSPDVAAFVLYVQGNSFSTARFTVTAEAPDGTTVSTSRNIVGNGGAQGVAMWTDEGFTLTSIEVSNPTGSANGFAIGEFSYAVPAPGAIALIGLAGALSRRRKA